MVTARSVGSNAQARQGGPTAADAAADVVVIGGGHNGLVCANYLADRGLTVTVLEANERVGGMTACSTPFAAAPEHLANDFSVDTFFWSFTPPERDLQLEKHGLRFVEIDPGHVYLHPEGASIAFWRDPRRTIAEIRRISPRDAKVYADFAERLDVFSDVLLKAAVVNPRRPAFRDVLDIAGRAVRGQRNLRECAPLLLSSVTEVVDEYFTHPVIKDAMHASCGSTIPNDANGSALAFLWLATRHKHCGRRPVGGVQAIPDALARRLESAGGTVITGARVERVLVENGQAHGVRLADGRTVRGTTAVVASCDPHQVLNRLLPTGALSEAGADRASAIATKNGNIGQMKVDVALSGRLELSRHAAWRDDELDLRSPSHIIGTESGMRRGFARSAAGLLPGDEDFSILPVIPTAADPSQAPDGQDVLYLYVATAPLRPEGGWEQHREAAGASVLRGLARYYDGLAELELDRRVLTNADIEQLTGATDGNITHVDLSLSRAGLARPARGFGGFRTPIDGLYLGGAGSHPGGGITGAPGYLAAMEVLRGKGRRRRPSSRLAAAR